MDDVIVQNDNIKTKPLLKLHPISENIYNTRRNEAITDWFKIMANKNYKSSVRKDGTHSFTDFQGNTYFNNGRMMSSDGQMADYDYKSLKGNALTGEDLENWKTAMRRLRYKEITLKDGSTAFQDDNGTTYYNNGRMLDQSEPIIGTNFNKGKTVDYDIMGRVKQGKSFRESDNGKSQNSWFTNAMLGMAMAEDPAAMTASGWRQNSSGDYVQDKVDDPGVEKLRNNLAVLGTGVTAGIAAPVVGPAVVSEAVALKPFLPQIGKNMLAGMFGADAFNATTRAVTGQSFDDYMVTQTPIKDLPISQEWKYMIGGTANPGGWLGFGTINQWGHQLTNTISNGLTKGQQAVSNAVKSGVMKSKNKSLTKLYKFLTAEQRANDILETFSLNHPSTYIYNFNKEYDIARRKLYKDLDRELYGGRDRVFSYKKTPELRDSKVDLLKYIEQTQLREGSTFPFKYEYFKGVPAFVKEYSPYMTQSGKTRLPVFGTTLEKVFNINNSITSGMPVSNYSTRNATNTILQGEFTPLPEDYIKTLKHNIEYVKSKYPGSVAYGSSIGVTEAGLPHSTHDIDLYITDIDLKALGKEGLPWRPGMEDLTKIDQLDGGIYGEAGNIDLNIIKTRPDGTIDFTSDRARNLFRQLYPDEFQRLYLEADGDLEKIWHPMQAKDLLKEVDKKPVLNTIMDAFESEKPQHMSRALWYLNHGEPDLIYEALLRHGESLVGKNMRHAPVTEQHFQNYSKNLELIKEMKLPGILNPDAFASDPKKMRNLFEYWWQNNTVVSRGTSIENMPEQVALSNGVRHERNFKKYALRNLLEWSGGVGGTGYGAGLNTVYYGNSNGGVHGNDIYGQMQLALNGYTEGLDPEGLMAVVRKNFPYADTKLDTPITITDKYGYSRTLTTFRDILNLKGEITPEALSKLGNSLGIRGIVGDMYNLKTTPFVGLTSPATAPGDIYFINPASGRSLHNSSAYVHPTSAHRRALQPLPYHDQFHLPPLLADDKHTSSYARNRNIYTPYNKTFNLNWEKVQRRNQGLVHKKAMAKLDDEFLEKYPDLEWYKDQDRAHSFSRRSKIMDILYPIEQRKRNILIPIQKGLAASPLIGILGYAGYQTYYGDDIAFKAFLDQYDLTPEQLQELEKHDSVSKKVRLLYRWEYSNKLKPKWQHDEK